MTIDREQTRRDAENMLALPAINTALKVIHTLARHCLALLTELEQAEARNLAGDRAAEKAMAELEAERDQARDRLAKTPALVEAVRHVTRLPYGQIYERDFYPLREALAAWEAE